MKNFKKLVIFASMISALVAPALLLAEDPVKKTENEDPGVMPVFSQGLADVNQSVIDAKNTQLTAAAAAPDMPDISAPATTTSNGTIVMTFTDGTLTPEQLSGLWAQVKYDGKTEYWKLDPAMLSADGKSFSMQFGPEFAGTPFSWKLYGFATDGTKTDMSNSVTFTVSNPRTIAMPDISAPSATAANGQINVTLASAILPAQLNDLWAVVSYDGKTEYWNLDPGMLSDDGKTFTMKLDPKFDGKSMTLALFGYASADKSQTNTTNKVTFTVASPGSVSMPSSTAPSVTTAGGEITVSFASAVLPSQLNGLWAKIDYDGKTEYWELDPGMISSDGKSFSMSFGSEFNDKTVTMTLFGYAASDSSQTSYGASHTFKITASGTVTMPQITAAPETDPDRTITVGLAEPVLPSSLNDLWAVVSYDGKTEYWDLDPSMISADGRTFAMQFDGSFAGKDVTLKLYGYAKADNTQTNVTNGVTFKVISSSSTVTMPAIPATITTDYQGKAIINFTSGSLTANQLNDLWAEIKVDGKTEYWDLDPSMLSSDGKSLTIQFETAYNGKSPVIRLYGFDKNGTQTGYSNPCTITVNITPATVTMPVLPGSVTTDTQGKAVIGFSSGTLTASQINDLWAEIKVDGKTQYWDLDPEMLSADGKSMTIQFDETYNGKTVGMRIYGFDKDGKQTSFSNQTSIVVNISSAAVNMPVLPASVTTDEQGKASIIFSSGSLSATQLNDLWAEVKYDGKTEYWDLDTDMLSADGKSMSIQFDQSFDGKTIAMRIYGFDKTGVQTSFSNSTSIKIDISSATVTMPVLPASVTTDSTGTAAITFASGTLTSSQLNDLWAEVKYDGKTEYWDFDPAMLSSDGRSMSVQFDPSFNGKTVQMKIYGFDKQGVQTAQSNSTSIIVNISQTQLVMPTLPSSISTDASGQAIVTFANGSLLASQINDLWAQVTIDGKTEYWDFDPAMLSSAGTSMSLSFDSTFKGKTIIMRIYAFDKQGIQTAFSNSITITVI